MITGIYHFIAAIVAWIMGLSFIRLNRIGTVLYSGFAALICGSIHILLTQIGFSQFNMLADFLLFLVIMLMIRFQ